MPFENQIDFGVAQKGGSSEGMLSVERHYEWTSVSHVFQGHYKVIVLVQK